MPKFVMQPHTAAKHKILRTYLGAWLPIMGSRGERCVFIDGFAGPGKYEKGQDGSPLIFLKTAAGHRSFQTKPPREIIALFSDIDQAIATELETHLKAYEEEHPLPKWLKYEVQCGAFSDLAGELLDDLDAKGRRLAPTLAFLDPFGVKGMSFEVVKRIVTNPSCEILVTFMYESMNRFKDTPEFGPHMDLLFGTPDWREVFKQPGGSARENWLVGFYKQQLENEAEMAFVREFRMINEQNRTEYYLVFGTNKDIGLSRMKEAMWDADPAGGTTFRDLNDPEQQLLFALGDIGELRELLLREFSGKGPQDIREYEQFVLLKTNFCERRHLRTTSLKPLEQENLISVERPPGSPKRVGTYPEETKITVVG